MLNNAEIDGPENMWVLFLEFVLLFSELYRRKWRQTLGTQFIVSPQVLYYNHEYNKTEVNQGILMWRFTNFSLIPVKKKTLFQFNIGSLSICYSQR